MTMRDRGGIVRAGWTGHLRTFELAALAAALSTAPAAAKDVLFPAAKPAVAMTVPEGWVGADTPLGLELQSPRKDSLVLAGMVSRDHDSVQKWVRQAEARMMAAGIVFAKPTPPKSAPKQQTADARADPSIDHFLNQGRDQPFTFSGAPSVDKPALEAAGKPMPLVVNPIGEPALPTTAPSATAAASAPSAGTAPNAGPMRPTRHFDYSGSMQHGTPVDIEFAIYPVGTDKAFLIEQESGQTDSRGAMIVRSLRAAP